MRNRTKYILMLLATLCFIGGSQAVRADDAVTAMVPALVYFPILPFDAVPDAEPELVPVTSNRPLTGNHVGVTRAIIVIHDMTRDASQSLATMITLAGADNKNTLIAAPQFFLDSDLARYADHLPRAGQNFARWLLGAWEQGGDSLAVGQNKGISSFTVIDFLLLYLADHAAFPDLRQIIIAGHGAGADFALRYAATGRALDSLDRQHVEVRFVLANPSSALYFTSVRFKGGKQGFGVPDAQQCVDYNRWPYGLEGLNPYARRVGANTVKLNFPARRIDYLTGARAAQEDPSPDASCAALLEGASRLARMENYQMYTNIIFGDDIRKSQHVTVIPKVGYDPAAMFGSACGMAVLFGDGVCRP